MFEAVRTNKRVAQVILAILIVPFAFFGMDAYFSDSPTTTEVATVGGTSISVYDFEQALRDQQDRLRASAGGQADQALLNSPELRAVVLDNLISQRVLSLYASENRLTVTPQQLQQRIAMAPAFQEDGRFSLQRYEMMVRAQGMTPERFESLLAQDLRVEQISTAVGDAGFASRVSALQFLAGQLEERSIRELRFPAARFVAEASISDAEVEAYYAANPSQFERPARLQAEYLVFDRAAVEQQVNVGEDELRAFYEGNADRFGADEERQARHILLALAADASAAERDAVMAEANGLVEALRADPSRFDALAREKSQDPGSASRGGDLGFFGRGMMVGEFEDAVFGQQEGEIGEPVRSDFGVHVIQVTAIKPAARKPFDEVREEILAELRAQAASRRYAELAEQFANTVYEQPDSLAPAAEALGLEVRTTDWIAQGDGSVAGYANPRLVAALFSDEAVKQARNTEAVEVANSTLVAARVKAFEAAQRLPLDEVRGLVAEQLRTEAGVRQAQAQGAAVLASLQKGEQANASWGESRTVQRGAPSLPAQAMQAVFSAPTTALPAYVGLSLPEGDYVVYSVDAVTRPEIAADDPRLEAVSAQYAQLLAERDFGAFLAELRQRYKVEIKQPSLLARD